MKWLIGSEDGITGPLFRVSFVCFNCMVFSGLTGFLWFLLVFLVFLLFPCVFILLVCFSQQEYERLKSEATALEDTIDEFRRERDSYIADIRTLEQSCKDVMRLMLESIQKYEKIKADIRECRNELDTCVDNLVFDLIDLN